MHSTLHSEATDSKFAFYQKICEQLGELLGEETNFVANAANTTALLYHSLPNVNWVGFYLLEAQDLVLGPFQGKPACTRIPLGKGVCGTAAVQRKSIVVPDVKQFPGHIACDAESRSEIVVPLLSWGRLLGVLDVDSAILNRFDEDDREGLESVGSVFLSSHAVGNLPDLGDEAAEV